MTNEQIIKALECCRDCKCKECPCYKNIEGEMRCTEIDEEEILDLINRQKAEIERLKETPVSQETINRFKADVVKEFAERLRALFINDFRFYRKTEDIVEKDLKRIDNLEKEMTEGKE